jgi:ribosome-associated translation inhibitor RaiA
LRIEEAHVRLEHRPEASPSFRVRVHLVTPGPDVVAESCGHTLHATIVKVMAELESHLGRRALKRVRRLRSNRQEPPLPIRQPSS